MLGVTYTIIECNKIDCLYNSGYRGCVCRPPENGYNGSEKIEIKNGKCVTYKKVSKKKQK